LVSLPPTPQKKRFILEKWKQLFVVFICVLYKNYEKGSQREKGGIFVIKSENGNMNQTTVFIVKDDPFVLAPSFLNFEVLFYFLYRMMKMVIVHV